MSGFGQAPAGAVVLPGATLGVMGGGQLGRMFVQAAQAMGYFTAVLDPDPTSPAGLVAHYHVDTGYLDEQGLAQLMQRSAAITTEFENVPAGALVTLGAHRPVAPGADAVAICQDRRAEKAQFARCGVPCAPNAAITSDEELQALIDSGRAAALLPGILKTARLGYDGKGQATVADVAALQAAWQRLGRDRDGEAVPCLLEQRLALALELSVVVARDAYGQAVALPVQQNLHRDGILAVTQVPAPDASPAQCEAARSHALALAAAMDYVGVLCVEFFVLADGGVVANEMAPRPHNSGHWSIDGSDCSQFELQVRTLTGLPLRAPRQHSAAVMLNLLGELWFDADGGERAPDWAAVLAIPGAHLHLYGKTSARPGRKMGHLTLTAATLDEARQAAAEAARVLGLPAPV